MARDEYDHLRASADKAEAMRQAELRHDRHLTNFIDFDGDCLICEMKADRVRMEREGALVHHTTGRETVDELVSEIDRGDAHLMTRNELVEFIHWIAVNPEAHEHFNAILYAVMNGADDIPTFPSEVAEQIAKEFFIEKGYEA